MSFGYSVWILVVLTALALAAVRTHHDWILDGGSLILIGIVLSDRDHRPD